MAAHLYRRLKEGIKVLLKSRKYQLIISLLSVLPSIRCLIRISTNPNDFTGLSHRAQVFETVVVILAAVFFTTLIAGGIISDLIYMYRFRQIGFTNRKNEPPVLIKMTETGDIKRLVFFSPGLPLEMWNDCSEKIESALNVNILNADYGADRQHIVLDVAAGQAGLPEAIAWEDECLDAVSSMLALGQGLSGAVKVDIAVTPHILLGGSTGSGKTVLFKLILHQCVCRSCAVYIVDFKGVDFNKPYWINHCSILQDRLAFRNVLNTIRELIYERKQLLKEFGCSDMPEYDRMHGTDTQRVIIAVDDFIDALNKQGLSKEQKPIVEGIENDLILIATQGRALGVHLFMSCQRPDATVLNGIIKNNMDIRIAGRCDGVLSQIILDNTDAADLINKNCRGRFLTGSGELFQAYYFNEADY